MTLQECLDLLARGRLSNLAICEGGRIKEGNILKVIDAVNEGMTKLYSIFPIKEKQLLIELLEGRTDYLLTSEHSLRNFKFHDVPKEEVDHWNYYIRDTDEHPFEDDILQIMEVWDDIDRKRPLNDPDNPLAVFTPEPNLLIVNYSIWGRVLNVVYKAKHLLYTKADLNKEMELPEFLYGALLAYVAYLIHSNINTQEAVANSQKYFTEYQNIINEVNLNGLFTPDKLVSNKKFIKRGWV